MYKNMQEIKDPRAQIKLPIICWTPLFGTPSEDTHLKFLKFMRDSKNAIQGKKGTEKQSAKLDTFWQINEGEVVVLYAYVVENNSYPNCLYLLTNHANIYMYSYADTDINGGVPDCFRLNFTIPVTYLRFLLLSGIHTIATETGDILPVCTLGPSELYRALKDLRFTLYFPPPSRQQAISDSSEPAHIKKKIYIKLTKSSQNDE